MKFYVRTLGCKVNQLDSARLSAALEGAGHLLVSHEEEADCVVVNSCTVTAQSDRKSRQAANGVLRGGKRLAVVGCGPRSAPERWRSSLSGGLQFESHEALLEHFGIDPGGAPFPLTARTRLPVSVQTGCDDHCTFCITRLARGPHRSLDLGRIVEHVREAFDAGVREVVITGINLAAWGASHTTRPGQSRLHELLEALLLRTEMPRIRLSSLGPQYLQQGFFDVFEDSRLCDHLHLSVQSGAPSVLRRMERGHDAETVYAVAERARAVRPHVGLTADFIVGFPGESDIEFDASAAMIDGLSLAKLHVFPFSPREGTPAADLAGPIDGAEKKRRASRLREVGRAARGRFLAGQHGRAARVLVEHDQSGLSTNYIRLAVPDGREGTIVDANIEPGLIVDR